VGIFAVQIAKWKGAYVYATASDENITFSEISRVDKVIITRRPGLKKLRRIWMWSWIHLEENSGTLLAGAEKGGILVSLVGAPPAEKAAEYGVRATYRSGGISKEGLQQIEKLVEQGILKPVIRRVFSLEHANRPGNG